MRIHPFLSQLISNDCLILEDNVLSPLAQFRTPLMCHLTLWVWGHLCCLCILNFIATRTHLKFLFSFFCFICSECRDILYKNTFTLTLEPLCSIFYFEACRIQTACLILIHICGLSHWSIVVHSLKWYALFSSLPRVSAQILGHLTLQKCILFSILLVNPIRNFIFHKSGTIKRYISSHSKTEGRCLEHPWLEDILRWDRASREQVSNFVTLLVHSEQTRIVLDI